TGLVISDRPPGADADGRLAMSTIGTCLNGVSYLRTTVQGLSGERRYSSYIDSSVMSVPCRRSPPIGSAARDKPISGFRLRRLHSPVVVLGLSAVMRTSGSPRSPLPTRIKETPYMRASMWAIEDSTSRAFCSYTCSRALDAGESHPRKSRRSSRESTAVPGQPTTVSSHLILGGSEIPKLCAV